MREALYGRNAVYETLRARRRDFYKLSLAEGIRETDIVDQIVHLAQQANVPIESVDRQALDRFGNFSHQGVVLEASEYPYSSLDQMFELAQSDDEPPLFLLLDLLKDPHNVGSLLRTAEAVGVHGIVIQRRRAVDITPTVVHTSVGAVEHLRVAQVTNLVRTLGWLKDQRVWVAGMEAVRGAQRYDRADLSGSLAVVVGSEGKGMRRLVRERCDFLVQLPMRGAITSLNASVAGSVVLYEALRQRQLSLQAR
ncbi:MAG: 23S rRNA (guanosine(2251)-2'-O)-methyltransferase RlmB [Chloroflexota bacterium]|nr:23S rRNA (guanosine(2251)-2'-O)-methyltransferase RlmB [Chloroflexota bacterium]